MAAALGPLMDEVVVQAMVPPGQDVAVSVEPVPIVGAALCVGPGGAVAALLGPTARAVLPLTDVAAGELIERSGMAEALGGDGVAALTDVLARVAVLVEEVPEVVDLRLNPVIVGAGTAWCTDVVAEVEPYQPGPPEWMRRLGP
jgi:hypothetical protein